MCDVSVVGVGLRGPDQAFIAVRGNKGVKGAGGTRGGDASESRGSVKRVKKVGRRRGGVRGILISTGLVRAAGKSPQPPAASLGWPN